ncbi:uncharacterized protein DSM5745_11198 [Aspergillus mulundensis]|uniref:Ubiquitin conjugating enzyme n=1 Tax=Aspergillus mulundensis TaxID=1810919 RepID=A0A3D8QAX2_9EURO|nr:Uncharacterized protein DSM5745_11198 [Aspergillus mulundensis]RDW58992.1 Uncharacterized protein DSM5745_11198 [Aspergillus mulundensis]
MTVSQLVRRGVEAFSGAEDGKMPNLQVGVGSPVLAVLLFITIVALFFTTISIAYTYGQLVPTLAVVEDSNPELYLRVDNDPANKNPADPNEAEMEVETPAPRPITSKLRTTISHLRARAGRLSRFRGFSMFITMVLAESIVTSFVPLSPSSVFGGFIVKMIVSVLLANLQVAWVHIVISEPSPKRFYQRIPSFRSLQKILPAAAFENLLTWGAYYVTLFLIRLIHGLKEFDLIRDGNGSPNLVRSAASITAIAGFVSWLASFPARVIFVRVAASMLPAEDEAIIPFDRSFDGKVAPEVVGGGVLSITDAWKTMDRDGWKRYVKANFKAMALYTATVVLFSTLITAEILGGALAIKSGDDN